MNNEEKIMSMLEALTADVGVLKTAVSTLVVEQQKTGQRLDKLEADVIGIKSEVSGIKTEVSGIKSEVSGIKTEVSGIKTDVAEIKNRIAFMENYNMKQFGVLYDGYRVLYDVSSEIRSKLGRMEAQQEKHDLQILRLDAERMSG